MVKNYPSTPQTMQFVLRLRFRSQTILAENADWHWVCKIGIWREGLLLSRKNKRPAF
jgi:hypothetical protein